MSADFMEGMSFGACAILACLFLLIIFTPRGGGVVGRDPVGGKGRIIPPTGGSGTSPPRTPKPRV